MSMDSHIRGSSRVVCLLGNPVAHSISPQIHNHAFRILGLPYVYIPVAVKPSALSSVLLPFVGVALQEQMLLFHINPCS